MRNNCVIEGMLHSCFQTLKIPTVSCTRSGTGNYNNNKKAVKDRVKDLISNSPNMFTDQVREYYNSCKKKDDLADAILICRDNK